MHKTIPIYNGTGQILLLTILSCTALQKYNCAVVIIGEITVKRIWGFTLEDRDLDWQQYLAWRVKQTGGNKSLLCFTLLSPMLCTWIAFLSRIDGFSNTKSVLCISKRILIVSNMEETWLCRILPLHTLLYHCQTLRISYMLYSCISSSTL